MSWGKELGYSNMPCPNCGRVRLIRHENGKSYCEKCQWSPEEGRYVDDEEIFEQEVYNWYGLPEQRLYTYQEVKKLHERIAELENRVVQMEIYDDKLTESRVFRIKFNKLLDPDEAMDIFVRNIKRIFEKKSGDSGQFK